MQEKRSPVFMVATANDVSQLPPEMLRKGRFDELWFVDLPNQKEREAIWAIQIAKYRRDPKDFDTVQLARATDGLTGSEIENVFVDAMFKAFETGNEPTDLTIASGADRIRSAVQVDGRTDYGAPRLGQRPGAKCHVTHRARLKLGCGRSQHD